jgi:hypothetical protein
MRATVPPARSREASPPAPTARVVLCCSSAGGAVTESASPWGGVSFSIKDPELPVADGLFLLSVLLLTEHHQDAFLHRAHPWCFVESATQRRFSVPHPPRIETSQALLGTVSVKTRVRLLIEACNIAVPVWTAWAEHGDLSFFFVRARCSPLLKGHFLAQT